MLTKRLMVLLAPDDGGAAGTGGEANSKAGSSLIGNSGESSGNSGSEGSAGTSQSDAWQGIMPTELRGNDAFKGYDSAAAYFKSVADGFNSSAMPDKDADQKTWDAWRTKNNIPTKAESYKLDKVEGLSSERVEQLKSMYHELNMSSDNAKALHSKMMDMLGEGAENLKARDEQVKQEFQAQLNQQREEAKVQAETSLRKEWGDSYSAEITKADRMIKALASEEELAEFNAKGYLNNATFIKMMSRMQTLAGGDSLIGTQGKPQVSSERLFKNSQSMYN